MAAKVENLCMKMKSHTITVDASERACINCIWYEPHYRMNRGNIAMHVPISHGYCLLNGCGRGALRQPCGKFETEAG